MPKENTGKMIRQKFKKEIAEEFGLKMQTFRYRLNKYKIKVPRGLVSPVDQKKIYDCLGYPIGIEEDDYISLCKNEELGFFDKNAQSAEEN